MRGTPEHPAWLDAIRYFNDLDLEQAKARLRRLPPSPPVVVVKTLADYSDADLVMEMMRRGYAAMKLPADGSAPEVLRR